jgi:cobalt-zinc-cadmium efflux system protein
MLKHQSRGVQKRFIISMVFTALILAAEFIGGLLSGSLALISDAAHVFMDLFALALSLIALKLANLPPDDTHSYGWHRLEVFAALINGLTLFAIAIGIWVEAFKRWQTPVEIQSTEMLIIAVIGLVVNVVVALILGGHDHQAHEHSGEHDHKDEHHHEGEVPSIRKDINLNSAFLHVIGDAISSLGVILAAILIKVTNLPWIDPLMSILIGFIILFSSFRVLRGSLRILSEGVPEGLSTKKINQRLVELPGVLSIHDLHVWSICSGTVALSAHVVLDRNAGIDKTEQMQKIKAVLAGDYGIDHTTIQFEETPCAGCQGGCN